MNKKRERSPLQQWSWNRGRLAGFISFCRGNIDSLLLIEDFTEAEKEYLRDISYCLDGIRDHWNTAHQLTRIRRVKE